MPSVKNLGPRYFGSTTTIGKREAGWYFIRNWAYVGPFPTEEAALAVAREIAARPKVVGYRRR